MRLVHLYILAFAMCAPPALAQTAQPAESVEREIVRLEYQVSAANVRGDVSTLRRLLSDSYIAIESNGIVQTKEQQIGEIANGSLSMDDETPYDLKVRAFGDTAVVNGRLTLAENRNGKNNKFNVLFTDVWIKTGGRWQVVSYQGTRLPNPASANIASDTKQESDLVRLESQFNDSLIQADLKTIEDIEANDLVFTDAAGMVTSKADEIRSIKSGEVKFESIKMTDTRVQDFGSVGVVTGSLVEKAQYKNTDISGTYRFTDVWAKRNDKWQHVAGQETLVSTPAEASASGDFIVADVKAKLATLIELQLQYDAKAVDKLLDPEFVYVAIDGSVVSRAEFLN